MKRILAITIVVVAVPIGFGLVSRPASAAPCSTNFSLAKVAKQGSATSGIAGSGTVLLQVQVNADGSHKVMRVQHSTNSGDNAAATEIASTSIYHPALCGTKAVTTFYDFRLVFKGKSLASNVGGNSIDAMLRAGKYTEAKAAAQSLLAANPNNDRAQQLLGVANYELKDMPGAAAAFAKASTIDAPYRAIAAQALSNQSVVLSSTDPASALTLAQRAMTLSPDTDSKFALGLAQLANKNTSAGIATLEAVRANLAVDPKVSAAAKFNVDLRLMMAYVKNGDLTKASALQSELKSLNPSSPLPARVMASHYYTLGRADQDAKNYEASIKDFELAASQGDPQTAALADSQITLSMVDMPQPDYASALGFSKKALALDPNNQLANYAAGVAQTFIWSASKSDQDKASALDYLNKADALAKAAGNTSLAKAAEDFIAKNINNAANL